MGYKRPFDDEELQELLFKNPRQLGDNGKLTQFADAIHYKVEGGFHKQLWCEEFKTDALDDVTQLVGEDSETTYPLPLVTSTSSEEDKGTGVAAISPEYFDNGFPRRKSSPVENDYIIHS